MTKRDFEQFLRAEFREMVDDGAPSALRARILAIPSVESLLPERGFGARWGFVRTSRFAPIALAVTAVAVALLIGIGLLVRPPDVGPSPVPGPTHSATMEPSATPQPSAGRPAAWVATGSMIDARMDFTATLLPDGRVLVAGGDSGYYAVPRALASAELYDPVSGAWTTTGPMITGRYRHTATLLPDGKVLVAGGNVSSSAQVGSDCCLASAELYDPRTGTWTATGSMIDARVAHSATLLLDGTVLVAGGDSALVNGHQPGVELYSPTTGTWTPTGSMIANRHDHSATLLPDGRVFVVGGSAPQDVSELYGPSTSLWSTTDCCTADANRFGPYMTATLLKDGSVLVAGGLSYNSGAGVSNYNRIVLSPSAALYDPAKGTWTATGSMITRRDEFTATLLSGGRVLVVGGSDRSGEAGLASAELYDASTGSWTATASMAETRYRQKAIVLLDGRVLVVGGASSFADGGYVLLASAELYDPGSGT